MSRSNVTVDLKNDLNDPDLVLDDSHTLVADGRAVSEAISNVVIRCRSSEPRGAATRVAQLSCDVDYGS